MWVLVLHSWNGGMIMKDNIFDYDSCDRMLRRAIASGEAVRNGGGTAVSGTCTQMRVFVPKAAVPPPASVINVLPAPTVAPVIKNNVIIKKATQ